MAGLPKRSHLDLEDTREPPPAYEVIEHAAEPSNNPPTVPRAVIPLEVVEAPSPLRARLASRLFSIFSYAILPLSAIIGCAITAGTTYALVRHVQNLVATARVGGDMQEWAGKARTDFYEKCYFGCGDVKDLACTYNACARTVRVQVQGQVCNAVAMWNWQERYPSECLLALGREYKREAVEALRNQHRMQYAVISLTVLAGLVGGFIIFRLFRRLLDRYKKKPGRGGLGAPLEQPQSNPPARRNGPGRLTSIKGSMASMLALCGRSRGYPCLSSYPKFDQVFVSADGKLSGLVHGWMSDCYDETVCVSSYYHTKCMADKKGTLKHRQKCSRVCWTEQRVQRTPQEYVEDVLPRVQACGFSLGVNKGPDMEAARVGNPLMEKDRRITISVNGFNVSDESQTDTRVWCLYYIGGIPTFD